MLLVVMAAVSLTALNAHATSYIYDALNRLTRVTYDNGSYISYTYDPAGNILQVDTYNATTPVAITRTADALSVDGATLHATVNARGEETSIIFEYGTTSAYGSTIAADQSPLSSSSDITVSATLSGLPSQTAIHYRVVATNTNGTGTGTDLVFTTYSVAEGSDDDGDGIIAILDNCPLIANPAQTDSDLDGVGDVCDQCVGNDTSGDTDNDGFCDNTDNCTNIYNPDQANATNNPPSDDPGDACDTTDADNDGYSDMQEYLNKIAGETDPNGGEYDPKVANAPGGTGYKPTSNGSKFWNLMLPAILGGNR